MKDTKTALTKLSSSINLMIVLGAIAATLGFAIYVSGAQRLDEILMAFGTLLFVSSLAFFSLTIIGVFLKHSTAVIIEGLQNNQPSSVDSRSTISFTTDAPKD